MPNPPWTVLSTGIPIGGANLTIGKPFEHPAIFTGPMVRFPITPNVFLTTGVGANMSGNFSGGVNATFKF